MHTVTETTATSPFVYTRFTTAVSLGMSDEPKNGASLYYANNVIKEIVVPENFQFCCKFKNFIECKKWINKDARIRSKESFYFDYCGNQLNIEYMDTEISEEISGYLYGLKIPFHNVKSIKFYNNKIYKPYPILFEERIKLVYQLNKTRRNFVTQINHIFDMEEIDNPVSLYKFKIEPFGYCDKEGNIIYNFDFDRINEKLIE